MVKAYFNNTLIAENSHPVELEGNQYFPRQDVRMQYLVPSDHHTVCPWKGKGLGSSRQGNLTNKVS